MVFEEWWQTTYASSVEVLSLELEQAIKRIASHAWDAGQDQLVLEAIKEAAADKVWPLET